MFTTTELEPLKAMAAAENAAIITFIAPDKLIRLSPASYSSTLISTNDVYRLEEALAEHNRSVEKAFLLLHSPGGSLSSSYNIARYLRKKFTFLHVFVPYEAASGATLMSLAGNKLTLGELGYITPIDPQIRYRGEWVSSYGIVEKVSDIERRFKKLAPEEMPIPWKQMVDQLDLVQYREMETLVWEAQHYAMKLLESAQYSRDLRVAIAMKLARNTFSHGHCFDSDACKEMGLKIDDSPEAITHLSTMKALIHIANDKETDIATHFIDVVLPGIGAVTVSEEFPGESGAQLAGSPAVMSRSKASGTV
jgi:Serine dehydrogenase proteinase